MDGIFAFKEVCFKVILPALNETEKKMKLYMSAITHTGATQWRYYAMHLPL